MPRLVQEFENVRTFQRKLYVKAKQEKEFRFYSLYDKIYRMDVLRYAWTKCKANKGAPGVDGRTFKSIEENEGVENFLNFLATELENGTYKSQPVRRVYIPKPDGSQRPLGIPCIKDRVAQMACLIVIEPIFDAKARFTSLAYIITSEFLMETWRMMNRKGASGVDGETTRQFESQLEERTQDIWSRMKANCYKAPPVRRVEIPKGNGKTRPLGIPTVENRLVQRAVARILEAIFEQDFLNFSYGFRPGRNPHQALQSLRSTIVTKKVRHIFEADIRGYFNHINHEWLMKMLKQRIADPVILRLVGKWLKAGVMENGVVTRNEEGTPQGGPISPILANIYLHYVLDLWFEKRCKKWFQGEAYLVRFADDYVVCFQYKRDAENFQHYITDRMKKFNLELAEEKTRLILFGRFARETKSQYGEKPETFDFLGFKHVCGVGTKGEFALIRIPTVKSCRKFLDRVHMWLKGHMHWKRRDQQKQLTSMLQGFYQYFSLYHCKPKLDYIRNEVVMQWIRSLRRRSQRHRLYWSYLNSREWFKLPYAKLIHPNI